MKKKNTLVLLIALVLVLTFTVGGTLAWLTAKSEAVVNTFTTSDINITLEETKGGTDHQFKMIPGYTIGKDPKVTVLDGSEDCWLFVKVEKSDNFDAFMTYDIAEGWTLLDGVSGVYYRQVKATDSIKAFSVLKDDQVSVLGTVTKEDMNGLTASNYPFLTFTAYATQLMKSNGEQFLPADAWNTVKNLPNT